MYFYNLIERRRSRIWSVGDEVALIQQIFTALRRGQRGTLVPLTIKLL